MEWQIQKWICGGFKAVRPDGEKIFIYRKLAWEPARYAEKISSYEFRWHGLTAGRLTAENSWRKRLKLLFTLDAPSAINEQDLLEISRQLTAGGEL
ncbi:MAG: hypothetical protein WCW52_09595 [Elusimicrobiales bacterium]